LTKLFVFNLCVPAMSLVGKVVLAAVRQRAGGIDQREEMKIAVSGRVLTADVRQNGLSARPLLFLKRHSLTLSLIHWRSA